MKALPLPALALLLTLIATGCASGPALPGRAGPPDLRAPATNAVTFWGHACAYVDVEGTGIVTDPVFDPSYALVRKRQVPAPPREAIAGTDLILISHAHQDHLSRRTLALFPATSLILGSPAVAAYVAKDKALAPRVRVMKPGDQLAFRGGRVIAVPAHHPGGRLSIQAKTDGNALGYVIQARGVTLYYSGDTGAFAGISRIGRTYRSDVALLNVNAHLHSEDARDAALALGSARVVPLHFGAYGGPREATSDLWLRDLGRALGPRFVPLELGESLPLSIAPAAELPAFERGPQARARMAGVPRFAEVEPGFSRGGRPSEEGIRALAARGYRTVVSLRHDEEERARVLAAGMEYVEVPMKAGLLGAPEPTGDQARAFLAVVGDPARRPVFVHCRRGKDRTGVMVALYRVARCGWTAEEAIEEMNDRGMSVHYRAFRQYIRERGGRSKVG